MINNSVIDYENLSKYFTKYLDGTLTDEIMTDILKYICKEGLSREEVFNLVEIFIKSGDVFEVNNNFIDKHSTGGVGDKTTLIVLPILASLGVKVSKMSGKALGHTGGTIDKLNSIGVRTNLTKNEFYNTLNNCNMVISAQTDNLCPMDKKVYALRDVTGTTKSVPLIAISIMSKKIASGASKILLDVKVGKGALVEDLDEAKELANLMIDIGKKYNREVVCMLTKMDNPLGNNVGNKIEILEVIDVLKNGKRNDLSFLCIEMASIMYTMQLGVSISDARIKVLDVLNNGKAYDCFSNYVDYMGGDLDIKLPSPKCIFSKERGYIKEINSEKIGLLSMGLGAGRINKDDEIDYSAGVVLEVSPFEYVDEGDILVKLYGDKNIDFNRVYDAFEYSNVNYDKSSVIIDVIR